MHRRQPASTAAGASLQAAVRAAGFRSVQQVRVLTTGGRPVAEATGVLHRYPQTVRVSLATANRLARAGAPLWIDGAPAEAVIM